MYSEKIKPVTTETFDAEVLQCPDRPVVVDFWGKTCAPCKQVAPRFEQLANNDKYSAVKYTSVCVEENLELVKRIGVRAMPTFQIYWRGEKIFEINNVGYFGKMEGELDKALQLMRDYNVKICNEPNTAEPDDGVLIDATVKDLDSEVRLSGYLLCPGTKVLLTRQTNPDWNGVRVVWGDTDMAKVRELYDSLGVPYEVKRTSQATFDAHGITWQLTLTAKDDPKVKGYAGFICEYNFDHNGKFIDLGIWE